ncbi:hypothetical protein FGIG_03062 [Fasciola gigantica]|uniref:Fibronectin type-III domain-containing protein n=1 Tax=Fasciola gigantica TaxID=46835 RepID=A0A504YUM5_FASGI|nr:hypothetical protein FGIG_03062 [Fasciola gigantica]
MTFPHWISEDYFHALVSNDDSVSVLALDKLVDDVQTNKRTTTIHLLSSGYGDAVISNLILWLQSGSERTCGNAAFVLGSLAEDYQACLKIINNPKSSMSSGWMGLADVLVSMLNSPDEETILNAAGTLGTIAECDEGRDWLLDHISKFDHFLECLDILLLSPNRWIASNAALVLARCAQKRRIIIIFCVRSTVSEKGLWMILESSKSPIILEHLVNCLGADAAGCGMNCAFALGRVCDAADGVQRLKKLSNKDHLLSAIKGMLATIPTSSPEWGVCKNACYFFSCLVATPEGNQWVVTTPRLLTGDDYFFTCGDSTADRGDKQSPAVVASETCILSSITKLLDMSNLETSWFAAMAIRSLLSQPRGLIAVRRYHPVVAALKDCLNSPRASQELFDEATVIMRLLGPLPQAPKPKVLIYGQTSALVRWPAIEAPGNLPVTYMLYFQSEDSEEAELVYKGSNLEARVKDLQPYTEYTVTLKGMTEVEEGPPSEAVYLLTEEALPPAPTDLHAATVTTNQVRLTWNPPKKLKGVLRYYMVRVECLEKPSQARLVSPSGSRKQSHPVVRYSERTTDPCTIISGLSPQTLYSFSVCVVNGRGVGPSAVLSVRTQGLGPHWPSKPSVTVLGRSEVIIHWEAPKVAMGRITRYEVFVNKQKSSSFAGPSHSCRITGLQPDTEYTFTVVLVTNLGKFESKPTKKRTAKDEYACPPRVPLYELASRRNKMSDLDSLHGKSRSVCENRATLTKPQYPSPSNGTKGRVSNYSWLASLSMPNLVAPSNVKLPNPRGDRANPVRTNSTPAMQSEQTNFAKSTRPTVSKAALIPSSYRRSSNILYKTQMPVDKFAVLEPTAASRDPSVHSLKSNSGDRSTPSERLSQSRSRSPKPVYPLIPTPKLEPTLTSEYSVSTEQANVQKTETKVINDRALPRPRKRSSGFWHFKIDRTGEKKRAQSAHLLSESAQSVGSNRQQNWRDRLHAQIHLNKGLTDNFYAYKKPMVNLFRRNFWQKRRPSTTDSVQITLVKETNPIIQPCSDIQENRRDPPSIRLIPPSVSGTQETSSSSSVTMQLNSPVPTEGIQAPISWNRVTGQSVTVQTSHAVVNPLEVSAKFPSAKAIST